MTDYDSRYEGNGEDADNYGDGFSPQARAASHGGHDTHTDSKSQVFYALIMHLNSFLILPLFFDLENSSFCCF